jgi:hypothetical protein
VDLPPRPPAAERPAAAEPAKPVVPAAPKPSAAGGGRAVPPGAWEKVREGVRQRSRPTAALLEQPTQIDRWEAEGAVVIRVTKAWKDLLEAPAKKKILAEEILRVFGEGSFPRFEVGDGKPAARQAPPPPPPPPAPRVEVPAYVPPTAIPEPHDDIPPPDDGPSAWLDEVESARPPAQPGAEAPRAAEAAPEDNAVKLAVDLFNGRVVRAPGA